MQQNRVGKDEYLGVPSKDNGFTKPNSGNTNPQNINVTVTVNSPNADTDVKVEQESEQPIEEKTEE